LGLLDSAVRKVCLKHFEKKGRLVQYSEEKHQDLVETPEFESSEHALSDPGVQAALERLSETERSIVKLDCEGHPALVIAEMLGTTVNTVYSRKHDAIKKLKQYVREYDEAV